MVARTHKVWVIPVHRPVASAYVHILFYLAAIYTLHFVPVSSQYRRGNDRRPVVPRRSWTDREEAVLMVAMKELVARGWKSDNGFRGGYLSKVEEWMQKEFPRMDLKANPHIQSKLTAVKKCYNSLVKILDPRPQWCRVQCAWRF